MGQGSLVHSILVVIHPPFPRISFRFDLMPATWEQVSQYRTGFHSTSPDRAEIGSRLNLKTQCRGCDAMAPHWWQLAVIACLIAIFAGIVFIGDSAGLRSIRAGGFGPW